MYYNIIYLSIIEDDGYLSLQKRHPDPQGSVSAGDPDPQVTLPMSIPTSILMSTWVSSLTYKQKKKGSILCSQVMPYCTPVVHRA